MKKFTIFRMLSIYSKALVMGNDLHIKLIDLCQNSLISESLRSCYDKIILIGWASRNQKISEDSHNEHRKMVSALKNKDSDKFKRLVHDHVVISKERILEILKQDSSRLYFVP